MAGKDNLKPKAKYIPNPERLRELWDEYVVFCKENPFVFEDFRGSDPVKVEIKKQQPPTLTGFQGYLARNGIVRQVWQYFSNRNGSYGEYAEVVAEIRAESEAVVLNGAIANYWNANLAGRYLGIANVTEQKVVHEIEVGNVKKVLNQKELKLLREVSNKINNGGERVINKQKGSE